MKTVMALLIVACIFVVPAFGQLKSQETKQSFPDGLLQESAPAAFFGWFNPEKFHMHHSFNLSYQTFGSEGLSLGTYTNTMLYNVADNLHARADVSLSYSPNNTFTKFGKNNLSSVYLSRAQLDYKPWDNFTVQIQYRNDPYRSYSRFYNPWYREDGF